MKRCFAVLLAIVLLGSPQSSYARPPSMEDAFSPNQGATTLVIEKIDQAKKTIHVAAYSFTSEPIANALAAAHDRGVDVDIVVDKSQRRAKNNLLAFLRAHAIPFRVNDHYAIMHNKFMIIDSKILELGSFNYTNSAEKKNAENVLVIRNKKIIKDYERQWQKLWAESKSQ